MPIAESTNAATANAKRAAKKRLHSITDLFIRQTTNGQQACHNAGA